METPPRSTPNDAHRPGHVVWFGRVEQPSPAAARRRRRRRYTVGVVATFVGVAVSAPLILDQRSPDRDAGVVERGAEPAAPPAPASFLPITPAEFEVAMGSNPVLAVRAKGPGGAPLADTVVGFQVESGGEVLATESVRTDVQGIAQTRVAVPSRPGAVLVTATVKGSGLPAVIFSLVSRSGPATRVAPQSGDRQRGPVDALLPLPIALQVTDAEGHPVPDAEVRFESLSGGGVVPSRTRTDSLGRASARWRLGPTAGEQRLAAVVPSAPDDFLTFSATAVAAEKEPVPVVSEPEPPPVEADAPPVEPEPAPAQPVSVAPARLALGGTHTCVLSSSTPVCRGANDRGQRGDAVASEFVALASGVSHVCALDRLGTASCWGANQNGQLGDGTHADRDAPVRVATDLRFTTLAAGVGFTCGLVPDGRAACWGQNLNGQLGDGSREDRRTPALVAGARSFRTLAAGWNHACGVTAAGETYCWGLNAQGQIGDGTKVDRLVPTRIQGRFQQIAAGASHTCGLSEGRVLCWGGNGFGQLGDGRTATGVLPLPVPGLRGVTQITAGAAHSCALVSGGAAHCWGQNLYGQLGDGTNRNSSVPTRVAGTVGFSSLHAGGALTCAVAPDGAQYCWGINQSGQLGDGSRDDRWTPTRVGG